MGRTIPSFRMALAMEKECEKPFRNALTGQIEIGLKAMREPSLYDRVTN
jgi:hypothetical protein